MANLARSAKPPSAWTSDDLKSYNITIESQDMATFFGQPDLPAPTTNPKLLTTLSATDATGGSSPAYHFIRYMERAIARGPEDDSVVGEFAVEVLKATGYYTGHRNRLLCKREGITLFICDTPNCHDQIDVGLLDGQEIIAQEIILLVQEDKQHLGLGDPIPQLVAKAIAVVQMNNNLTREFSPGCIPPLKYKMMAGIIMNRSTPTFFKIPITSEMMEAVELGQYPPINTTVAMHIPDVKAFSARV